MPQEIIDLLIGLVNTGGSSTRIAALNALGEGAPATDDVINCLRRAAEHGGADTRAAAITSLGKIYCK
ncbi:TPA: HEAT repeat domain-containing protein [Citrobacter amalonaticus]|nr:HEAT repeat domain-containing protein [Citrobacter amalonaticus]HCB1825712.1 HEAT repeat domain-containing protein [Citrobacter amalonaticus]HCB1903582.1 HEAT repeat domain-containing protein [Citrobacter amalonaticus]HEM6881802.1 HEAT repeat domain-containing protein [Citrobacter amalonaticus]